MKGREGELDSVFLRMITRGSFPGQVEFEVVGSMRVLGETHFHVETDARFGEDFTARMEMVRTPEGAWIHERDPAQGEVFLRMEPELLERMDEAIRKVGEVGGPGVLPTQATSPMGSAMVESLSANFDLELERRTIDGDEFWVLKGDVRSEQEAEALPPGMEDFATPDRVEVLVRARDLTVVQMTQFRDGEEITEVEITELIPNAPLDESTFVIEPPPGQKFVDIMEHLPAATHIRQLFEEAGMDPEGQGGGPAPGASGPRDRG